jgi:cytidylate kinase
MEREGLDASNAKRFLDETDRGRHEFAMRFFRQDIADPHIYDLVINTERIGFERAAELIVSACHNY